MAEVWLPICEEPFRELYQISNFGRVKNTQTGKTLNQKLTNGYKTINLRNPLTGKTHTISIHRCMMITFVPNVDYKILVVNHKDGDKTNNNLENLEWCTQKENVQHSLVNGNTKLNLKSVTGFKDGIAYTFESIKEAAKVVGCHSRAIGLVLCGKNPTAKGYTWKYTNAKTDNTEIDAIEMKIIPDFPNYMVSKKGDVYNVRNKRIIKPILNKNGYVYVTLCVSGKKKNRYIHTLVAKCFIDNPENKLFVNHIDGNKTNNNIDNLEWCTQSENTKHYYNNKTSVRSNDSKDHYGSGENSEVSEKSDE